MYREAVHSGLLPPLSVHLRKDLAHMIKKWPVYPLILLITYKAVHGHVPNYIKVLINFKKSGKYILRSNSDNLLLEIEKEKTYTTLGDRAFQVAAPKLWNNLPFNIRSSLSLPSFKKALKTHLFREAFSGFVVANF